MMKSVVFAACTIASLLAGAGCASTSSAGPGPTPEASAPASRGAVMLVQKKQHLDVALATARSLIDGARFRARAVEIVACGEATSLLVAGGPLEAKLHAARDAGVRVIACAIALERVGIDRADLSRAVDVVENGLVEVFERQSEGYLSIEL